MRKCEDIGGEAAESRGEEPWAGGQQSRRGSACAELQLVRVGCELRTRQWCPREGFGRSEAVWHVTVGTGYSVHDVMCNATRLLWVPF